MNNENFTSERKIFRDTYFNKNLKKQNVINVLVDLTLDYNFIETLQRFLVENVVRRDTLGVVYSDEYDPYEEEYFGEDKVLFYYYYGLDEIKEDIVTHDELCNYLEVACDFYIKKHPNKNIEVKNLLEQIKEKYQIKEN
ncbi:ribonuclease toxin immunity protein CdiI [Bacillus atrophaeus]|uniref:ribonuclease toxin immunity protein CdiI n=1 Tax=Bacillus atrophaeus TaxID=1452 RepID=UPI002DB98767|nr:ribonuclease toxin immunity protein CdiI [Bacillus atrophaeus]MEC0696341.1 ribonuclease toxin immunity protein CdiI [Bacillus atrophaeus]